MSSGICGIILAAGESSRMGRDKALLPWPKDSTSSTLLSSAIRVFSEQCDLVIVVAGKNAAALEPAAYAEGAFLACNPDPQRGQFSSLQTGLQEVLNRGRDRAMVTLVDRPPSASETLAGLLASFETRNHATWAVVPEYQGRHGHPILIGREMIEAFLSAPATGNAREMMREHQAHVRYVAVDDPRVTMNVDTPEEYGRLDE